MGGTPGAWLWWGGGAVRSQRPTVPRPAVLCCTVLCDKHCSGSAGSGSSSSSSGSSSSSSSRRSIVQAWGAMAPIRLLLLLLILVAQSSRDAWVAPWRARELGRRVGEGRLSASGTSVLRRCPLRKTGAVLLQSCSALLGQTQVPNTQPQPAARGTDGAALVQPLPGQWALLHKTWE